MSIHLQRRICTRKPTARPIRWVVPPAVGELPAAVGGFLLVLAHRFPIGFRPAFEAVGVELGHRWFSDDKGDSGGHPRGAPACPVTP
jgi:hypothetical protein